MKSLLHFFMFLLHFCLIIHANVPAQSQCHEDDLSALLQIKKKSLPDSSWNSSTACCSWVGVSCSTDGHVTGLDISGEFNTSQIDNSSSLFDLQHLQSLDMSDNCLVGNSTQIPSAVGKLTNLRYLNLAGSCYSGQVPIEIAHLTKLAILDLSGDDLNLYNPNLSTIVQNLTELTELYLDGVTMSALDTHWCQSMSSSLPRLQVLSLSSCKLSGPIDPSLAKLQSLSVIRLDDNNKLPVPVPGVFANMSNLTSLSLRSCMMRGTFPIDIFQVPTLQTIDLSDNPQLHGSLPELPRDGSLQSLVLQSTNFSGLLPDSIGNLRMLSLIDLTGCSFTGPVPKSIQNLTKLVHLYLSWNEFNGSIDSIEWEKLVSLQDIKLESNLLDGGIPSSIFSPPLLEELVLSDNQFSGQLHEFSNVSSHLAAIDLSFNDLEGVVPVSIYSLRGLEVLDLFSNNFSGFPFNGPQQLSKLSTIDLSNNSLLGFYNGTTSSYSSFPQIILLRFASNKLRTFPDFFRNHTSLAELDLSANQIQGMIPNWIWGLPLSDLNLSCNSFVTLEPPLPKRSAIFKLDLHSNQLQGQIPAFIELRYVDYSQNNFSSSLPTDIGDLLLRTTFLSLSSNNLHGAIPVSICNGSFEHLDMSNNSLTGNVPGCLLAMGSLRTLILGNNNLSGAISNSFGECGLRVLDLGRNQMEGQFPKSLANCTVLEILNLGNNHMIDTFPCFLKNISSLRVLVLGSNKLYGGIGCSKTNGSWPKLQIIDLSHNCFRGEILGRSFTTWHAMMANADDSLSKAGVLEFPHEYSPDLLYYRVGSNYQGDFNYYAAITVIGKGIEMKLVKIITVFTLIDFSDNKFNGSIPKDFGELKSLYFLNLSSNAFTGEIPSSLGNLRELESLDLSQNKLRGQIPADFAKFTSLAFLNLSNNQLVGRIPKSTQFSTFTNSSFLGNKGLWGPPLTEDSTEGASPPTPNRSLANSGHHEINWDLIVVEIGFAFGFGVAVCSLVFCKRWSKWYYRTMYKMVVKIFPQLEERIGNHRRHAHINPRWRN